MHLSENELARIGEEGTVDDIAPLLRHIVELENDVYDRDCRIRLLERLAIKEYKMIKVCIDGLKSMSYDTDINARIDKSMRVLKHTLEWLGLEVEEDEGGDSSDE